MHVGKAVWAEKGGRAIQKRAVLKDNILQRGKLIGMQIDECELEGDEGNRCNSPETSSPLEANCP